MYSSDLQRHVGKYYGKYSGIVVDNKDPEQRGNLRVRVDSVFGPKEVVRARPCFASGHFFVPDPEARIWVEFEGGDSRYPIWVGTWYPTEGAPPEGQHETPTHRVVHTPSGHVVELSDEPGAERVVLRHREDAFVALEPDGSVIVSNAKGANLYLNAGGKETTLMGQQGHMVSMTKDALLLVNDAGSVVEMKGDTVSVLASKVVLSGTTVAAGANATDPTIMGNAFSSLWQALMLHTHPTAMGPSGPPGPPGPLILPLLPGIHLTSSVVVK
jgi:hypothetical protein